jgi:hypothetical protein
MSDAAFIYQEIFKPKDKLTNDKLKSSEENPNKLIVYFVPLSLLKHCVRRTNELKGKARSLTSIIFNQFLANDIQRSFTRRSCVYRTSIDVTTIQWRIHRSPGKLS